MFDSMGKITIVIEFFKDNLKLEDVKRYKENVEFLILSDALETKGSRIYLDFDDKKNLMQIKRAEELLWRRKKQDKCLPLDNLL